LAAFAGLFCPLVLDILERVRRVDGEADEEDMGLAVG
jgi:hypothetical protein